MWALCTGFNLRPDSCTETYKQSMRVFVCVKEKVTQRACKNLCIVSFSLKKMCKWLRKGYYILKLSTRAKIIRLLLVSHVGECHQAHKLTNKRNYKLYLCICKYINDKSVNCKFAIVHADLIIFSSNICLILFLLNGFEYLENISLTLDLHFFIVIAFGQE